MLRVLHLAIIQTAALLVPAPERAEWLAEWRAELWYVNRRATAFSLGSFSDALWMNRNISAPIERRWFRLESPLKCVMFLAGLAGFSLLLALSLPVDNPAPAPCDRESQSVAQVATTGIPNQQPPADDALSASLSNRKGHPSSAIASTPPGQPSTDTPGVDRPAFLYACFGLCSALLVALSRVTPLRLGEYPVNRYAPAAPLRLLRWVFLAVKIALVVSLVLCGALALGPIVPPLAGFAMLFGPIFGFRWALMDQRERCPVCLRLLSNPTCIGDPSQLFLGWYGTELLCSRGHGFLYVPGTSTSWGEAQRWQYLDPTWSTLLP
jgi:hypothetical protein